MAARLLGALVLELGVESRGLLLDAFRLHLRGRLLGLSACLARRAVRAGVFRRAVVDNAGLVLLPEFRAGHRRHFSFLVRPAAMAPLLFRQLVRWRPSGDPS